MTVETIDGSGNPVTKSGPYNGNGATSVFDYDFQIQAETELVLTRQNADLTEDVLTLTTDYTVSGVGVDAGGQITLVAPATSLPTGTKLVIQYEGDLKQSADYSSQGSINLSELEAALDKLTMHLRGLQEAADRAVTVDAFGVVDVDTLRTNISALAAIEAQLVTLAANIADVNTAAGVSADITTVAGIAANVTSVAAIAADVTTAAANIAAIIAAPAEADAAAASALAAAASETAAAASALAAAASETAAGLSETAAAAAKVAAELALDNFTDLYLGAKAADPTLDNDGDPLQTGALYFNTVDTIMKSWSGTVWLGLAETPAAVLDEDDFASDSATQAPSQQSVGAYIGAKTLIFTDTITVATNAWTFTGLDMTGYRFFLFEEVAVAGDGSGVLRRVGFTGNIGSLSGSFTIDGATLIDAATGFALYELPDIADRQATGIVSGLTSVDLATSASSITGGTINLWGFR